MQLEDHVTQLMFNKIINSCIDEISATSHFCPTKPLLAVCERGKTQFTKWLGTTRCNKIKKSVNWVDPDSTQVPIKKQSEYGADRVN